MNVLSQRDPRWKNTPLGTSTSTTIGSHGCTITCVSMLAGLNPDDVNKRLKSVGGYANTNLIIWSKIKEAIPWLEFEWRGYTYENAKVLQAIEDNGACLVEVDFDGTPRTDDRHWVLFVGDKKMYDPWTGTIEPTSKYSILKGYAIINKIGEKPEDNMSDMYKGLDLTNKEAMKVAVNTWYEVVIDKLWIKKDELKALFEKLGVDSVERAAAEIDNRLEQISRLKGQLTDEQKLRNELMQKASDAAGVIKVYENNIVELNGKIDDQAKTIGEKNQLIAELKKAADEGTVIVPTPDQPDYVNMFFKWLYDKFVGDSK